jgi:lipoprotein-anchoring transpeptidase ErfK/SrfK
MRRFSVLKIFCVLVIGIVILGSGVAVAYMISPKPPLSLIVEAQSAISAARKADAALYAPDDLRLAETNLEEARSTLQRENERLPFFRDYSNTTRLALQAKQEAESAASRAVKVKESIHTEAFTWIQTAMGKIKNFKTQFEEIPMKSSLRRAAGKAVLTLRESIEAFKRGDYFQALDKAKSAATTADYVNSEVSTMLTTYLANAPQWRQWVQQTIDWSASRNAYAIIVDKMAHACYLYFNGSLKAKYYAEFGPAWIGSKNHRGDRATPEGRYYITKKRGIGQTKYYKALDINYPNAADLERFNKAKKSGELSKSASIGGLVEIHGSGGRGTNWTYGCIALQNSDMDKLFSFVSVGTPVTIVGSLQ